MARRAAIALAVALLALMAIAPVASAQEQVTGPYTGVAPIVDERPAVVPPAPEPAAAREVAAVRRPADVRHTEVLARTGFSLSSGAALSVFLVAAGLGFVVVARRRRTAAA